MTLKEIVLLVQLTGPAGHGVQTRSQEIHITVPADPASCSVVSQEGIEAVVGRVAVSQTGGVGDQWVICSRAPGTVNILDAAVPPTLVSPASHNATHRIVLETVSVISYI